MCLGSPTEIQKFIENLQVSQNINSNIYILCVFTEKPYSKPLERGVVYIPITTSGHATSMTSKQIMALCNLTGRRYHDVINAVPKLAEKLHVNGLLLQI